jgi:proline iminopeptidase
VAALCDRVGIVAPTVFGHSAGGFVALHLALRHPDTVGRLILCSTSPALAPLADPDPPPGPAQRASAEAAEVAGRLFGGDFSAETVEAFNRLVAPVYAGPKHLDVPGRLFALSGFEPAVAGHFFPTLAAAYDVRDRLPEIAVPTLVVVGGEDWVCPPVASRILAAAVPSARLVEIADAGHFPFSEEPAEFARAVTTFLGSTDQVPAGSMRNTG